MKTLLTLLLLSSLVLTLPAQEDAKEKPKEGEKEKPKEDTKARFEKRLRFADELEAQGDEEGALKILEDLSRKNPGDGDLQKRIGSIHLRSERYKEAIPYLRKALEIEGGSEDDHGALGRLMIEAGEHEAAVAFLEGAVKRFPESPDFPFLLTFPLSRLERWDAAISEFEKTLSLATGSKEALVGEAFHFRFAAAHERAGHFDKAVELFRKTIALIKSGDPDEQEPSFTATVLNYLAYMWVDRAENLEEAGKLALEAAELDPGSGAIADTVGWWHFHKGDYPRALANLKRAERLIENPDPVIFDHIGQTLVKLDEKEFAVEYFEKALALDPENGEIRERLEAAKK